MKSFDKIVNPVTCDTGKKLRSNAYAEIEYRDGCLAIHGVVGPFPSGNCAGSAGQCVDEIRNGIPKEKWTAEMVETFCDIWKAFHLNDMRPYCKHQKMLGWDRKATKAIEVYDRYRNKSFKSIAGHICPSEHPDGLLGKPCPICGYKYGTAWKNEAVPEEILEWLYNLPETEKKPAWI